MWIVNSYNVCFWLIWPIYNAYVAHRLFADPNVKIEFLAHYDHAWYNDPTPTDRVGYVACRLWADADHYYEWGMTEDGEMLRHEPHCEKRWWLRERIYWYHSTAGDELFKFTTGKSYSTLSPLSWVIRKQIREHFVMAKMGGFNMYRMEDETRQKI
jgi:hypothetical protein